MMGLTTDKESRTSQDGTGGLLGLAITVVSFGFMAIAIVLMKFMMKKEA